MGRNKIKIEKIKNERIRQVTFYKRKKGLLKKAMELGLLCDVKVFLCIVDKNDKSLLYSSDKDINKFINEYMLNPAKRKEIFTDQDYKAIYEEKSDNESESICESDEETKKVKSQRKSKLNSKFYKKSPNKIQDFDNEKLSSLPSSYVPSEESGIGKIKSKLSLKVQIPDGKIFESRSKSFDSDSKARIDFSGEKSIQSEHLQPKLGLKLNLRSQDETSRNKKVDYDFVQPSVIDRKTPSMVEESSNKYQFSSNILNDPLFSGNKRYRESDFMNFSPNQSLSNIRQLTPLLGSLSPNFSHVFLFNNGGGTSLTPTPIILKQNELPNSTKRTPNKNEHTFQYAFKQNTSQCEENSITFNNVNTFTTNVNSNNNIEIPNLILLPTSVPNNNQGFYTWVMQNNSTQVPEKKSKNKKSRKSNYKNE